MCGSNGKSPIISLIDINRGTAIKKVVPRCKLVYYSVIGCEAFQRILSSLDADI